MPGTPGFVYKVPPLGFRRSAEGADAVSACGCDLSIIVPAYNEAGSIVGTLGAMRNYLDAQDKSYEVIVSADGNDGTRERAREFASEDERFTVIGSAQRGGKGRGVRNGMKIASGQIIGFVDADYKTP